MTNGKGEISSEIAAAQGGEVPVNPATGEPYFRVTAEGWGTDWKFEPQPFQKSRLDELQQLEQLRAEHIGEIRPLDTLADAQRTVPGVNS